jgi:plasmid stabilization system protein ParE
MRVEVAPRARTQIRRISEWWRENRPAAPELFANELAAALETLGHGVLLGVIYPFQPFPVRRVFLPRSKYHVYYSVEADLVKVRAVWHAARGAVPVLT